MTIQFLYTVYIRPTTFDQFFLKIMFWAIINFKIFLLWKVAKLPFKFGFRIIQRFPIITFTWLESKVGYYAILLTYLCDYTIWPRRTNFHMRVEIISISYLLCKELLCTIIKFSRTLFSAEKYFYSLLNIEGI